MTTELWNDRFGQGETFNTLLTRVANFLYQRRLISCRGKGGNFRTVHYLFNTAFKLAQESQ